MLKIWRRLQDASDLYLVYWKVISTVFTCKYDWHFRRLYFFKVHVYNGNKKYSRVKWVHSKQLYNFSKIFQGSCTSAYWKSTISTTKHKTTSHIFWRSIVYHRNFVKITRMSEFTKIFWPFHWSIPSEFVYFSNFHYVVLRGQG